MDSGGPHASQLLRSRRRALERSASHTGAEGGELGEIDAALARIQDGSYGTCERCGGAIGRQRLLALPEVRYCASCSPR
jgi:RNA polymerase-binding transcription factor DksA